jgi:hypothetical protein
MPFIDKNRRIIEETVRLRNNDGLFAINFNND